MTKNSRRGFGIRRYITSSHLRIAMYAIILAVLFATVGIWSLRTLLFDDNLHTVIPNKVYRSAQPSPKELKHWIRELSLRSVINLRGERNSTWFEDERAVAEAHGVDLYNIALANGSLPPQHMLQQLVYVLDTAKHPLLLHCAHGIERSGIASAVAVLLAGGDVVEARKQFRLAYGFIRGFDEHPKMIDDYEQWLAVRGWPHTPERFRRWVENDYVPLFYRARLEPLDVPASITTGKTVMLRFRATNTSPQPWRFRSDHKWGIHLGAKVRLLEPVIEYETELRGGLRDFTVAPGEAVVLELPVPPLPKTGRYQFFVDLVDESVQWFYLMGSEPLVFELRVEASDK